MRPTRRRLLTAVVWVAVAVSAWFAVELLLGHVDWRAVRASLGLVSVPSAVVLVVLLLVRQVLSAAPLAYYVPGLSLVRSVQSDLTASLLATFAPTPSDIVVRVAMFRSWGLDPVMGLAGSAINSVKFYTIRFGAPLLGLVLLVPRGADVGTVWPALASALVAAVLLTALLLLARADHLAAWLGRTAARAVRRFHRAADPERWASVLVETRANAERGLRRGLVPSMVALTGMVLAEGVLLVVALRAVGVGAAELPSVEIVGLFLLLFVVTALPLYGLGVLDALLVAAWVSATSPQLEPELIAGTVVWRVVTLAGIYVLGLGSLAQWRWEERGR